MSGGTRAISSIKALDDRVATLQSNVADPWRKQISDELGKLLEDKQVLNRPGDVWPRIHSIEERVNDHDVDLVHLNSEVHHHLNNESRSVRKLAAAEFEKLYRLAPHDNPQDVKAKEALEAARKIIRDSHERDRAKFDSAGKTQAGLLWGSGGLLLLAVAAVIAQSRSAEAFVPLPEGSTLKPWLFLVLLLGAGALGGVLSALFSLYLTKRVEDTSWFDPRPALAVTKTSVGAWASVIAAVAVGTGALVGKYTSIAAALLIGVAFGYAQQALTGILDKYATGFAKEESASERESNKA